MLANLTGWHLLIVFGVIVLLFGATKLPALARGFGSSVRILRNELSDNDSSDSGSANDDEASHHPS